MQRKFRWRNGTENTRAMIKERQGSDLRSWIANVRWNQEEGKRRHEEFVKKSDDLII